MPRTIPVALPRMLALSGFLMALVTSSCVAVGAAKTDGGIGTAGPSFAVATSQDTLSRYDRDYYGRHHLVLSFFPAAFTPV